MLSVDFVKTLSAAIAVSAIPTEATRAWPSSTDGQTFPR